MSWLGSNGICLAHQASSTGIHCCAAAYGAAARSARHSRAAPFTCSLTALFGVHRVSIHHQACAEAQKACEEAVRAR